MLIFLQVVLLHYTLLLYFRVTELLVCIGFHMLVQIKGLTEECESNIASLSWQLFAVWGLII